MAIKMRNNTNLEAVCCNCSEGQKDVLNMFDLCIGKIIMTICDECVDKVFYKCLSASVMRDGRVKSPHDMAIIRRRQHKGSKWERIVK